MWRRRKVIQVHSTCDDVVLKFDKDSLYFFSARNKIIGLRVMKYCGTSTARCLDPQQDGANFYFASVQQKNKVLTCLSE